MKTPFIATALFLILCGQVNAGLSPEQQATKEQGIALFNQYKSAEHKLRLAAEAGDPEAQFYLAEELRLTNQFITKEAQSWYEKSAEQGDFYSMIRLGRSKKDLCATLKNCPDGKRTPSGWLKHAQDMAKPKAEQGDAEAMFIMYEVTSNKDWLEKSAEHDHAIAQYWMAIGIRQGEGFFLPWKRNSVVGDWLRRSAENGYPKAMMEYAVFLYEDNGDLSAVRKWIKKSAEAGLKEGISSYGAYLAHAPSRFDFPYDVVKGYGITSLLSDLDGGGGNVQPYLEEVLPEIAEKMTPSQIEEAKEFAMKWKSSHPPISYFPDKLGY
ncbi:tetratricopeptide repeat protein [Pseudomonas sp. 22526]|uniref:tetratricopeptide repeat protein n=1 Tax=Pseudomonas sp. 22526 TaxID=3453937 RepID=UPI003F83C27D